jgi:hypothetical protein
MGTLTASRYYRVTITGVSCTPALNSNAVLITVLPLPTISAGSDQVVCSGNPVILLGSGGTSYYWDNGVNDGVSFVPSSSLMYTVTGIGSNGCTNTDQVFVTVNPTPVINIVNNNPSVICEGQTFMLGSNSFNVATYQWKRNGINISGATSATYTGTQSGTYTLFVTSSQGCTATSSPVTISLTPLPFVSAGPDQVICNGDPVTLNGSGASSYSWNNGVLDGLPFYPTSKNTYTVSTTGTTGCVVTDQVVVTVNNATFSTIYTTSMGDYVLNGVTYTESGTYTQNTVNQFGCDSTITLIITIVHAGVDELQTNNGIQVFPNPSLDGKFTMKYPEDFSCDRITVSNSIGMILKELNEKPQIIDLKEFDSGTYFIEFYCEGTRHVIEVLKL